MDAVRSGDSVRISKSRSGSELSNRSVDSGLGDFVSTQTDVYICRGRADEQAASDLYTALKHGYPGIRVFFDKESIDWGQPTLTAIQSHLAAARLAVVLVSEQSLRRLDNRLELDSLLQRQRSEEKHILRPVLLGSVDEKKFQRAMPFIAALQPVRVDSMVGPKRFDILCDKIRSELSNLDPQFRQRSLSTDRNNVPLVPTHCNRHCIIFDLIDWLETCRREKTVARLSSFSSAPLAFLYGLPGIGKSLIAKVFGHRAYDRNWHVVYADASDVALPRDLGARIVDSLGLDADSVCAKRALYKTCHSNDTRILLILDGCDQLVEAAATNKFVDFLEDALRSAKNVKILVTSRIRLCQRRFDEEVFEVKPLDEEDAENFLRESCASRIDGSLAKSLAKYSHGHPMLLNHFSQIVSSRVSPKKLVRKIGMSGVWVALSQLLTAPAAQVDRIDTLFDVCLKDLNNSCGLTHGNPISKSCDKLCAFKATGLAIFPGDFSDAAATAVLQDETLANRMADRSVLERTDKCRFELNPLLKSYLHHVAKTKHDGLFSDMKVRYYEHYVVQLNRIRAIFSNNFAYALEKFDLDRHNFDSLLRCSLVPSSLHESYMDLVLRLNLILKFRWSYGEMVGLYERCADLAAERGQKTVTARFQILVADIFVCQGKADDAIRELEEAEKAFKTAVKSEAYTLALASCYATLGNAFRCKDNVEESLVYLKKAAQLHEENSDLGYECHVSVLQALGATYAHLNYREEALKVYNRARRICKQYLGGDNSANSRKSRISLKKGIHPYGADIEMSIAELKGLNGSYKDALDHFDNVEKIQEKLKIEIVPAALVVYSRGICLYFEGKVGEGFSQMKKALSISSGFVRFFIAFSLGKLNYDRKEFSIAVEQFVAARIAADSVKYTGGACVNMLVYGCVAANVAGMADKAEYFKERLRSGLSRGRSREEVDRMLASVVTENSAATAVVPKAGYMFYNQFCCEYQCLAKASRCVSTFSKFPFSDLGRSDFRLSAALDLDNASQETDVELPTPMSPEIDLTQSVFFNSLSIDFVEAKEDEEDAAVSSLDSSLLCSSVGSSLSLKKNSVEMQAVNSLSCGHGDLVESSFEFIPHDSPFLSRASRQRSGTK